MYMPPETVLGAPIDARGDLYSVGVITFEMLHRRARRFTAANAAALMELHALGADPEPLAHRGAGIRRFHRSFEHLVAEALQKRPDRRFCIGRRG